VGWSAISLSRVQVILVLAVVCMAGSGAFAAEPAEVEALIKEANKFRREGKDGMALPLMRKAYDLATTARTAAQLGLVEVALGYWLQAEQHLVEALSSQRDPWIHQNRVELQRVLAGVRASIGEIEIAGEPAGAEVLVNGQSEGTLPLPKPVRVGDGPVRLEVRARGYKPSIQVLTMSKGVAQSVDVRLARDPSAPPPPAVAESGPRKSAEAPPAIAERVPDGAKPEARSGTRTAAWLAAGAATVAVGVGAVGSVTWVRKREQFDNHTVPVLDNSGMATFQRRRDCGIQNENRGGEECARIYDDMNRAKTLMAIGYVAGGVLAAGALTLFLLEPSQERGADRVALACSPSLTVVGGSCRLAF
jgi:hypothetical protein